MQTLCMLSTTYRHSSLLKRERKRERDLCIIKLVLRTHQFRWKWFCCCCCWCYIIYNISLLRYFPLPAIRIHTQSILLSQQLSPERKSCFPSLTIFKLRLQPKFHPGGKLSLSLCLYISPLYSLSSSSLVTNPGGLAWPGRRGGLVWLERKSGTTARQLVWMELNRWSSSSWVEGNPLGIQIEWKTGNWWTTTTTRRTIQGTLLPSSSPYVISVRETFFVVTRQEGDTNKEESRTQPVPQKNPFFTYLKTWSHIQVWVNKSGEKLDEFFSPPNPPYFFQENFLYYLR